MKDKAQLRIDQFSHRLTLSLRTIKKCAKTKSVQSLSRLVLRILYPVRQNNPITLCLSTLSLYGWLCPICTVRHHTYDTSAHTHHFDSRADWRVSFVSGYHLPFFLAALDRNCCRRDGVCAYFSWVVIRGVVLDAGTEASSQRHEIFEGPRHCRTRSLEPMSAADTVCAEFDALLSAALMAQLCR